MGWMRRMVGTVVIGVVAALAGAAAPAAADVEDFRFSRMDADYTLTRAEDGSSEVRVAETFVAEFPQTDQNRGMRRLLPETFLGAPLEIELVSVTDGEGRQRPVEVGSDDGVLAITSRADGFLHGAQTFVFTYTMRNAVRFYDDTGAQEFYWNANGLDWPQPFGEVTARLHLDADLADALTGDAACYVGAQGATATCPVTVDRAADGSVTVTATAEDVAPFETLTFATGFAEGTFTPFDASYFASPWGWLQAGGFLVLLSGLAAAIVVRTRRLRDAPGRPTIIAEYAPPAVVDALESAVLLGRSTKAIPAEVLEQAVVGSIRIVEGQRRWFGGVQLEAHLVDPGRADGDGRMLLDGLFGPGAAPGEVFSFGRQDTRLSKAAQGILSAAGKELTRRGLRRPVPAGVRAWPVLLAVVGTAATVGFGIAALGAHVAAGVPIVLLVAAALGLFAVIALISRRPLTALGAETRDHLAGLEAFIAWAEADRIRMLQSPQGAERVRVDPGDPRQMLRLYEALLPYAVVFGQEKEWAERLAVLYDETGTPGWYAGTAGFNAAAFSSGIGSLSASVTSASSTSGGSTGGGSAGGGGGGGGGGGV